MHFLLYELILPIKIIIIIMSCVDRAVGFVNLWLNCASFLIYSGNMSFVKSSYSIYQEWYRLVSSSRKIIVFDLPRSTLFSMFKWIAHSHIETTLCTIRWINRNDLFTKRLTISAQTFVTVGHKK